MHNSKRTVYFDVATGILIVNMVMGHLMGMSSIHDTDLNHIRNVFFFFMPWFFFKSGIFCSDVQIDCKAFVNKCQRKYMRPYVFFSFFGFLCGIISLLFDSPVVGFMGGVKQVAIQELKAVARTGATEWNAPLWFLLSLFVVRVVFNAIREKVPFYIILLFCVVLGWLHSLLLGTRGIWIMGNVFPGMFFYILGYKLKSIQYNKYFAIIALLILVVFSLYKPDCRLLMFGNIVENEGNYLLSLLYCLAGIIVFNNFLFCIVNKVNVPVFSAIGIDSIYYYVLHWPLGKMMAGYYYSQSISSDRWALFAYLFLFIFGGISLSIPFLKNKLGLFVFGRLS